MIDPYIIEVTTKLERKIIQLTMLKEMMADEEIVDLLKEIFSAESEKEAASTEQPDRGLDEHKALIAKLSIEPPEAFQADLSSGEAFWNDPAASVPAEEFEAARDLVKERPVIKFQGQPHDLRKEIISILRSAERAMTPSEVRTALVAKYPGFNPTSVNVILSTEAKRRGPIHKTAFGVYRYIDNAKNAEPSHEPQLDAPQPPTGAIKCNQRNARMSPKLIGEHKREMHPTSTNSPAESSPLRSHTGLL
jgi:hypothetical protein